MSKDKKAPAQDRMLRVVDIVYDFGCWVKERERAAKEQDDSVASTNPNKDGLAINPNGAKHG